MVSCIAFKFSFMSCNSVNGCRMISPKVIVECPDLSANKQFKKENPLRRGGSTPYRGDGLFKIGA